MEPRISRCSVTGNRRPLIEQPRVFRQELLELLATRFAPRQELQRSLPLRLGCTVPCRDSVGAYQ
jgi:hypothetical protein